MLPWLTDRWILGAVTGRAALAGLAAFLTCVLLGGRVIAWLKRRKVGEQTEKGDSRQLDEMMRRKRNTPTMGGVFLSTAILVASLAFGSFEGGTLALLTAVVGAMCLLGSVDDWLKLSGRSRTGMTARAKMAGQAAIGVGAGLWLHLLLRAENPAAAGQIAIPLVGPVALGWGYPLFVALVVVACSNAVNITDGLDGLAGGCMAIASLAYAIVAYAVGRTDFSAYLGVPYVAMSAEASVFCAAVFGAALGFLWYNSHPAQVFMGDSGSLPLGGALGLVACITRQEFLLVFIGGIFVVEAGSSLLQIVLFKLTGRRLFRIAPLHHHFQFAGMAETKITQRFWIGAAVLAVLSLISLKAV